MEDALPALQEGAVLVSLLAAPAQLASTSCCRHQLSLVVVLMLPVIVGSLANAHRNHCSGTEATATITIKSDMTDLSCVPLAVLCIVVSVSTVLSCMVENNWAKNGRWHGGEDCSAEAALLVSCLQSWQPQPRSRGRTCNLDKCLSGLSATAVLVKNMCKGVSENVSG